MSFTRLPSETEEEWLEQRREYITATEIARLAASPAEWKKIRDEKKHGSDFHGNRVTRWGHVREPEIGKFIHMFEDSRLVGNTDLCVLDGTRIAATPDMLPEDLSEECEVIGEIKTAGKQLVPDHIPQKYVDQVQVQLMVTGADACVFACEARGEDEFGEFFPDGLPKTTIILPDLDRQAFLRDIAERFLAGEDPTGPTPAELESLALSVLDMQEDVKDLQRQIKEAKDRIREAVGDEPGTFPCGVANVIVTADTKSTGVDLKALREEHPDIVALYPKITPVRGAVKVLPVKQEEPAA
ncbi:YqaJ viral recombinase family protein [Corynebacterium provencense]|uniref:YqaJ viral recombinase family protein n=1 Tax=Corynebacterium provencense TaxID=1737425 RepID=UPI0008328038|nr:YqaJ viral recombinase family protein [Corynebacterium provencense]